jgi:hypothetical protein
MFIKDGKQFLKKNGRFMSSHSLSKLIWVCLLTYEFCVYHEYTKKGCDHIY